MTQIQESLDEVISKYYKKSPLDTEIATEYPEFSQTIVLHTPDIPFEDKKLLEYAKKIKEESILEDESTTQEGNKKKRKRPPNSYFLFMVVFKELVNKLVINETLDGKARQKLGAMLWNCLKEEFQKPYKSVAKVAREDFPQMTYKKRQKDGQLDVREYDPKSRKKSPAKKSRSSTSPSAKKNQGCTAPSIGSSTSSTPPLIPSGPNSTPLLIPSSTSPSVASNPSPSVASNVSSMSIFENDPFTYFDVLSGQIAGNYPEYDNCNFANFALQQPIDIGQLSQYISPMEAPQTSINIGYPPVPIMNAYNFADLSWIITDSPDNEYTQC
ncbi:553_t:CDS:1 [Paraglomus brasilianum]|uniref:553_t:CDS:1 n=1 Tax=Paraglomus brasilianum TaxID=144538 RepID=A0A9N8ZGB8_9GLOM|nr:553_t:CDS:1 [Paraglomus brasilianum]